MRVIVIGGSSRIGSYLVPRLVKLGHEVIHISRSMRKPYILSDAWEAVRQMTLDRNSDTFNK